MLILSALMYGGISTAIAGALATIKPAPWLRLSTRRRAAAALGAGLALVGVALGWPTPTITVARQTSILDERMPSFQFMEHHETRLHASPERTFDAIRRVTASEIRFFSILTWIRHPRVRVARPTILAAPANEPLLDVALSSGFVLVGARPDREIVIATSVAPDVVAMMNFMALPDSGGWSTLTTETRVFASRRKGLREFTTYWRVIYPGSALIRVEWLRAIKSRAERAQVTR